MTRQENSGFYRGLVTRLSPTSPRFLQGMASIADNRRMALDDMVRRRPGLSSYISVRISATEAPKNAWQVHFDGTSGGTDLDYLIVKTGDGDGDDDGKLYFWNLAGDTAWHEILSATSTSLALSDTEAGSVFVANDFLYYTDSVRTWGWAPGYASGVAFTPGQAVPAAAPQLLVAPNAISRIGGGMRSYVQTNADILKRKVEGLPSTANVLTEAEITYDFSKQVTVTAAAPTNRLYRTPASSALRGRAGDGGHYYYIGEGSGTPCNYVDLRSDPEVMRDGRLNCRGGRPTPCRYSALHRGRTYYAGFNVDAITNLVDRRCIEWSSAGRPEEVARKYSVSISSQTIQQLPELTPGQFGEAKTWLPDDAGGIVTGLIGYGQEVLVTTDAAVTSLYGTVEPFSQRILSREVGCCAHRTLVAAGDYGLMGCDSHGPWVFNGATVEHVGRALLSLDSDSQTSVNFSQLTNSFGVYVRELREYWWFCPPAGQTVISRCIAYQCDRGAFTGPYQFNVGSGAGIAAALCVVMPNAEPVTILFTTTGYVLKVDATVLTDHTGTAATSFSSNLRVWAQGGELGKKGMRWTILYESITAGKSVTARAWAADYAIFTPRDTQDHQSHTSEAELYPLFDMPPEGRGRLAALHILEPDDCDAPIAQVSVRYEDER
jgi:hypothetical protein